MTPLQLTRSVRSLNRLRQIALVLTKHGFGHVVAQINLTRYVPVWILRKKADQVSIEEGPSGIAQRLVHVFEELGPTFIKLGQVLSTRPDLVPRAVSRELESLQDDVPPFDSEEAMAIIADSLDRPVGQCFSTIDRTPVASASIGQVHRATLTDGTRVVIKIRRPNIEHVIRLDIQILRWMAEALEDFVPESRIYRPLVLVDELEEVLLRELDFINEASVTSRFHAAVEGDMTMHVPRVYWDYTSSRILTLEELPGTNLSRLLADDSASRPRIDRKTIARRIAEAHLRQVLEIGCFHADPHPGNLLIDPPARVSWVDFGQTGTITDGLMTDLIALVYACVNDEMEVVVETLADMGAVSRQTDRRLLERSLDILLAKYRGLPIKRLDLGVVFDEFSELMRRHDVMIPRDLAVLLKASGVIGSLIATLDPELDILELVKPRLRSAVRNKLSPGEVSRRTTLMAWDVINIIRRTPRQLRALLRRASATGWELKVRHENIEPLTRELDRSSNRIAFSVVIAAIIVGSSVVFSAGTDLKVLGFPVQYFGIVGYLFAGLLGVGLSWAIFRSGRLH